MGQTCAGLGALAIAGVMVWGATLARAQEHYFVDGNTLLNRYCTGSQAQMAVCQAYIVGAIDMVSLQDIVSPWVREICFASNVTPQQVRDVVINHLRAHPEQRHQPASGLVVEAMRTAFPCPR